MTLLIMTLLIMELLIMELLIMELLIMELLIMAIHKTLNTGDFTYNDIPYNINKCNLKYMFLSTVMRSHL
jgi:hypothetical protein